MERERENLINCISAFGSYIMPEPSLSKNCNSTFSSYSGTDKGVHHFPSVFDRNKT